MGDRCFYFGCWGNTAGHYMRGPGDFRARERVSYFGNHMHIDGSLAPRSDHGRIVWAAQGVTREERSRLSWETKECDQGVFLLHNLDTGFTAVQWWDRTQGDTRGGCNSTVLLEGNHTAEEMLAALAEHWPEVLANLEKAGVKLVDVTPAVEGRKYTSGRP